MTRIRVKRWMSIAALAAVSFPGGPGLPQAAAAAATLQVAAAGTVEEMVRRALDYDQGDRDSLTDARDEFTPEGWSEFTGWLDGYLDKDGAPTGSSRFTPSGHAAVEHRDSDETRVSVPGTLRQQARNRYGGLSTTTYRVVIDVRIGGDPPKIRHMETITCSRRSTAPACR